MRQQKCWLQRLKRGLGVFQAKKKILCRSKGLYMAGAERLELATPGFGDRCSTN